MPHQPPARRSRLAWALLGVTAVLLALGMVIAFTGHEAWPMAIGFAPVTIAFALVGALVAARTGNRLGWVFVAGAMVTAVSVVADQYAARAATAQLPGAA
jgi:hypothetical protein